MAEPTESRRKRHSSFMAVPDADTYPVTPLVTNLCLIAASEGLDAQLFPSCTQALELTTSITLGDLSVLLVWQLIPQALAAPMWGIIASNAYLTRPQILIAGTFFQGLATMLMAIYPVFWSFAILRAINGICLASLRPIANSICGDRFPDEVRGKYFGYIMGSMQTGGAVCGYFAVKLAGQDKIFGLDGWKIAFILVGIFTMCLAPLVFFTLKAPPVRPPKVKSGNEIQKIRKLFQRWTFTALVIQGMFGLIPWRAMEFRVKFFQSSGLSDDWTAVLNTTGSITAALGSILGGYVGDFLGKCSEIHGRIAAAEISVYSGVPIAFFTFYVDPPSDGNMMVAYYVVLVAALGLMGTWTPAACNSPVLCSLSEESERSVVLSWQTGLEGAIGSVGGIAFTQISLAMGYDSRCMKDKNDRPPELTDEMCNNRKKLGTAMFVCTCVPWTVCGLFYSSLHLSYARDLESVQKEAMEIQAMTALVNNQGAELS